MTPPLRRACDLGAIVVDRVRRRLAAEDGLGLVEIMIAVFVLSVAVLGLATSASGTLASLRGSRDRQQATIVAAQAIEVARAYGYQTLAHRTGEAPLAGTPPTFDADGAGTAVPAAEELVVDPAGSVRSTNASHFATAAGRTVTTYVTWVNVAPGTRNAKRVTAVVTWGAGGARSLRQSALISAADAGLAAPDFDVNPRQLQSQLFQPGVRRCFAHTIQNQGETDRYDVIRPAPPNYTVTVHHDVNVNGVADAGEQLTTTSPGGYPMTPEVPTNGTVPLLICYQPQPGAEPTTQQTVTFRSVTYPTVVISANHWLTRTAAFAPDPSQRTLLFDGTTRYCYPHSITNYGEADRYRFQLPSVGGYSVSVHVDENGGVNGDGVYEVTLAPDLDGALQTGMATPTNGRAFVNVCYQATGTAPVFSAVVVVASTFNPDVTAQLTHVMEDPPPVFEVSAAVQAQRVGPQSNPCFSHVLTNRGVRADTYSGALPSVPRYTVATYVDHNANGVGEAGELLTGATPSVAPGGSLRLLVCYQLTRGSNTGFTAQAIAYSSTNTSVQRAVQHTVTVETYRLFLHDVDNTRDHARTFGAVYAMDHDPTAQTVLYDYDLGIERDGKPGVYITKMFKDDNSVRWQYTFGARTVISGASDLRLWSSYPNALTGSTNPNMVRPVMELQRRRVNGTVDLLFSQTFSYTHNQAGWMENVFTSTLPSLTFEAGESLVLRVYCSEGAGEHCHFAYDTTTHPAALTFRTVP